MKLWKHNVHVNAPDLSGTAALVRRWAGEIGALATDHATAAKQLEQRGRALAITSAVIATVVGTATFASLAVSPNTPLKIVTGALALLAAVLVVAPLAWNYPDTAGRHATASIRLGQLKRAAELLLLEIEAGQVDTGKMEYVKNQWRDIIENAPILVESKAVLSMLLPSLDLS